jgi:hypothetical protein
MARLVPASQLFSIVAHDTLAATKRALVATARREHDRVMTTDPKPSTFRQFVDGREGARIEDVKPTGIVEIFYPRIEEVVQFAMEVLFDRSPVDSGDYRNAHTIFVENSAARSLKDRLPGQEITIINPLPYSRKIEVGAMTMRVPGTDHVYQQARQIVAARWGNAANIKFTFRALVGGMVAIQERAAARGRVVGRAATGSFEAGLNGLHNRADLRYPCLVISER